MNTKRAWLMFLLSAPVLAGTQVSGGGHMVFCTDKTGQITTVDLLDLYETKVTSQFPLALPPDGSFTNANQRTIQIAHEIVKPLAEFSPLRAELYNNMIDQFLSRLAYVTPQELTFIPDDDAHILGSSCALKQIAYQQRFGSYAYDPVFFIDEHLWNLLTPLSHRSALMLHEIIYREFKTYGHDTSVSARRLLRRLVTNRFPLHGQKPNKRIFLADLFATKVSETDINGLWLKLWDFNAPDVSFKTLEFFPNNEVRLVKQALLTVNTPLDEDLGEPFNLPPREYHVNNTLIRATPLSEGTKGIPVTVEFHETGKVASIKVSEFGHGGLSLLNNGSWKSSYAIEWNADGSLRSH